MYLGTLTTAKEVQDVLPKNATHCRILVRHAKSVQDGPNATRTLTDAGVELCNCSRDEYGALINVLRTKFGEPTFVRSGFIRAGLTSWELFHPTQLREDPRLTLAVSIKKIDNGEWYRQRKASGATLNDMIVAINRDRTLLEGQPYDQRMAEVWDFFTGINEPRLIIGTGHEPEPTLWMLQQELVPKEFAGLDECQAYLVFNDEDGQIIGVAKFTPEATCK